MALGLIVDEFFFESNKTNPLKKPFPSLTCGGAALRAIEGNDTKTSEEVIERNLLHKNVNKNAVASFKQRRTFAIILI